MHLFLSYTLSLNNYSLSLTILRTLILSTVYPSFSQTLTSFPNRNLIVFLSVCCSLVSNSFLYIAQSFLHFLSPLPSLKIIISLSAKTALLLETLLELVIVSMRCLFRQRTLRTITFFWPRLPRLHLEAALGRWSLLLSTKISPSWERKRERETRSDSSPHMYMMVVPGATLRPLPRTKSSSSNGCTNFEALKLDCITTEDKSSLRSDCDSVLVQTSCLKFKMRFLSLLSVV